MVKPVKPCKSLLLILEMLLWERTRVFKLCMWDMFWMHGMALLLRMRAARLGIWVACEEMLVRLLWLRFRTVRRMDI